MSTEVRCADFVAHSGQCELEEGHGCFHTAHSASWGDPPCPTCGAINQRWKVGGCSVCLRCECRRLGMRCTLRRSLEPHEHFCGNAIGLIRWWDTEDGCRVNGKRGDGGHALRITEIR